MNELPMTQALAEAGIHSTGGDQPQLSHGSATQQCSVTELSVQRRLLQREQVEWLLQLTDEQVQWLINTRQITAVRISGEERFDSRDVYQLIDSYMATARRKPR